MGIDVYLSWPKMRKKEKEAQCTGFSIFAGDVGYLREAYHGGPYPSKILVREAFESPKCRARIPAALMRERLTHVTEPVNNGAGDNAEMMALIMQKVVEAIKAGAKDGEVLMVSPDEVPRKTTVPMTVEEAVIKRCHVVYPNMPANEIQKLLQSYRDFVALAEEKEKKYGKPCLVYASY